MPGTADSGISLSRSRGKRRRDLRSQGRPQPGGQVTVCWAQAAYWSGTFAGLVLAYGVVLSCSLEITKELVCIYCQESMRVPKSASTHVYRTCCIECTRAGPPGHGQTKRDAEWTNKKRRHGSGNTTQSRNDTSLPSHQVRLNVTRNSINPFHAS